MDVLLMRHETPARRARKRHSAPVSEGGQTSRVARRTAPVNLTMVAKAAVERLILVRHLPIWHVCRRVSGDELHPRHRAIPGQQPGPRGAERAGDSVIANGGDVL